MIIDTMSALSNPSSNPTPATHTDLHGLALLTHLGVIRAEGEEAAKFLHNQLTQDFALLGQSDARLAAFCSAKGRMQASFIGFKRSATEVLLVCHRDLLATTLKRLSMFVLRTKVKLSDASSDVVVAGLCGDAALSVLPAQAKPWTKVDVSLADGQASCVALYPALGLARALWVAPKETPLPVAPALSLAQWQWTDVRSGVATLSQAVFEAFVPQMLNYESVGGVNFKKGCYPGQEVVARSQFRGTLKRRAYLVHAEVPMSAGTEVFTSADPDQPCGLVAQAAPAPTGGWDALVSVQVSSVEQGLRLSSAEGALLTVLPLPYPLLEDI